MKKLSVILIILGYCIYSISQQNIIESFQPYDSNKLTAYLIPGMGIDNREFKYIELESYNEKLIHWDNYENCSNLKEYAYILSSQIDQSEPFILIGVSMGGMLAIEMSKFVYEEAIVIISSSKNKNEIPIKYKIVRYIPLYNIISEKMLLFIANNKITWRTINKDVDKDLYCDMLSNTGAKFLKWQMKVVAEWDNEYVPDNLIHIHGSKDVILPIRYMKDVIPVKGEGHKMIINKGKALCEIIDNQINHLLIQKQL